MYTLKLPATINVLINKHLYTVLAEQHDSNTAIAIQTTTFLQTTFIMKELTNTDLLKLELNDSETLVSRTAYLISVANS